MTDTVHWRPMALEDLARIVRHITEENPIAARRVGREVLLAGDSLAVFPCRGRRGRAPETRELVSVHPYIIVYQIEADNGVTIIRVWHGAQNRD